jgi:nitrate/nitrite transporter NarK
MIVDWFPPGQSASVMGFKQSGVVMGTTLAGLIFPTISILYGYPNSFLLAAVIVLAASAALLFYKENPNLPRRTPQPILQSIRDSLRDRQIVSLGIMGILFAAVQCATLGYTTLYLQGKMNFSPVLAGYLLSVVSLMGILSRPFFGVISTKFFHRNGIKTLFLIAVTSTLALIFVSLLNAGTPFWELLIVMSTLGLGRSAGTPFSSPMQEKSAPPVR